MSDKIRTLIVDDDEALRMLLRYVLDDTSDYVIVGEAIDGREAITAAKELQPDLVLLDLMMPRMDGFEALPHIRRVAPQCVVVALSMMPREDAEADVLRLGAVAFMDKGAASEDLVLALDGILGRSMPMRGGDRGR